MAKYVDLFFGGGTCWCRLQDGVEGPRLHRPENWLMRQLNDEPTPVYKVGFIREKGKAIAREE
jgi:hypothetical protein